MAVAALDREVFPLDDIGDALTDLGEVSQVAHAQSLFHILVRVHGGDAAAGRSEFLITETILLETVKELVIGHAYSRAVADFEVRGAYLNAALAQTRDLVCQVLKVYDDTGAEDVHGPVAQDAGGQQIEYEPALVVDDGVACVIAALIADDDIILFREQVYHSALSLVAPVCSYDCS